MIYTQNYLVKSEIIQSDSVIMPIILTMYSKVLIYTENEKKEIILFDLLIEKQVNC